jgi:hypothetical protein
MSVENIKLSDIHYDKCQQMRAEINQDTVADYRELFNNKFEFPPIVVFFDGSKYWLADGFHRVIAANELKRLRISAKVQKGSQRDAILYACGANSQHGLRRTNADKRRAVETLLADEEWGKWSSRKIAEAAGVSPTFVEIFRTQLPTVGSSKRIGQDGKERSMPKPAVVSQPTWDDEPEETEAAEAVCDEPAKVEKPKVDIAERVQVERSRAKKTVEALMRTADDLQGLRKSGNHKPILAKCRELIQLIQEW